MRSVYLAQVNYQYGRNTFLPHSAGQLWAYAMAQPELEQNFTLGGLLYLREPIDAVVRRMRWPSVLGLSCYIWNWRYSMALAKAVKERFPNCLIVVGGPQVPDDARELFDTSAVDVAVHGEGEVPFTHVLRESLNVTPDFAGMPGVSSKDCALKTPGERMRNLSSVPSPYLTGVFDELIGLDVDWHASQETHRGCPYSCTFCDWGSATQQKVTQFSDERIVAEVKWFAENKIELLYNCDANFGMLKRDLGTVEALVAAKTEHGYPKKFRAAWAKKHTPTVLECARTLNDAGLQKGVTVALQSLDDGVLNAVKRKNIALGDLAETLEVYRSEGIPTYSELILGLPGETYSSFRDGLGRLIEAGQHGGINIYPCIMLPNAEMNQPEYREKYGIKTTRLPMLLLHGSAEPDGELEYYELVTATHDMSHGDWRMAYFLGWAIQALHCLPLLRQVAHYFHDEHDVKYIVFYEKLLRWASRRPLTIIGRELRDLDRLLDRVLTGEPWDTTVAGCGDVTWPPEEATFLRCVKNKRSFFAETRQFLATDLASSIRSESRKKLPAELSGVMQLQMAQLSDPWQNDGLVDIDGIPHLVTYPKSYNGDLEAWAREVVWYGRKSGEGFVGNVIPVTSNNK